MPLPSSSVAVPCVILAKGSTLGSWLLRGVWDTCVPQMVAPVVFSQMLSGPRVLPSAELQDEKVSCLQGHGSPCLLMVPLGSRRRKGLSGVQVILLQEASSQIRMSDTCKGRRSPGSLSAGPHQAR